MREIINKGERRWPRRPGEDRGAVTYVLIWREEEGEAVFQTEVPSEVYESDDFSLERIEGTLVPLEYYRTPYKAGWTRFVGTLQEHHFVKDCQLSSYEPDEPEEDWPATEVSVLDLYMYERLQLTSAPTLAQN